jgi:predicted transglutaminase-like cysteine proteinase
MGRAKITGGGPAALYNVELVKDIASGLARIATITARLAQLVTDVVAATTLVTTAETTLQTAVNALDVAIDAFIADNIKKDALLAAQTAVAAATSDLATKRRYLSSLKLEEVSLQKEKAMLETATAAEVRTGIWCTDLTEELATGTEVGTMEINGEDTQIILTPGGSTTTALGKLRPTALHTPAGWFYNKALFPAWQKWKPTYRIGVILTIDYDEDTCDIFIASTRSREQGLLVDQTGTSYNLTQAAVSGWTDFAARNPTFPLVTNTANSTIPLTAQLKQDMDSVQLDVNSRFSYRLDKDLYGALEYWSLMESGGSGDCEDFALVKAQQLLAKGYSASALHIEVGLTAGGTGHAWLVVQTSEGDYALDISYEGVQKAYELPYTDRRRQTGMVWSNSGVKFSDVDIEYMDGSDSDTFKIGDRVVVQFIGQDWTKPKVIGYETNPRGDRGEIAFHYVDRFGTQVALRYNVLSGELTQAPVSWITKITDNYVHTAVSNTIPIMNRAATAVLTTVSATGVAYNLALAGDISYAGDVDDIRVYAVYMDVPGENANGHLYINGAAHALLFASVRYVNGYLYGVHGTYSPSTGEYGADAVYKMDRNGNVISSVAISSKVRLETYRANIKYDADNECFYLHGASGDPAFYGLSCGYSFYATTIEKYDKNWNFVYRRRVGAWCVTDYRNTLWQGEGWVEGGDFATGLLNTHFRYPTQWWTSDVYDDKLYVVKHTEELVWSDYWGMYIQHWVPSQLMSLDLLAHPVGASVSSLPFGSWLVAVTPVLPGPTYDAQVLYPVRHCRANELNN